MRAKKTVPSTLLDSSILSGDFLKIKETEVSENGFVIAESYNDAVQTFRDLSGMRSPDFTVFPDPEPDTLHSRKEYKRFLKLGFCKLQRLKRYHSQLGMRKQSKEYLGS